MAAAPQLCGGRGRAELLRRICGMLCCIGLGRKKREVPPPPSLGLLATLLVLDPAARGNAAQALPSNGAISLDQENYSPSSTFLWIMCRPRLLIKE
uniref:Uncharacterized protein n=1 Tax=Arundo donax TaxID=35708 RepID=A0A0A9H6S2_ARUDO